MRPLIWYWWDIRGWCRYTWHERLPWAIAYQVPRKVALFVFVRVMCADTTNESMRFMDAYEQAYNSWTAGKGR